MQEKEVKAKIQALIDDFKANKEKYERGSEADTETKLIEPLFELLGWTTKDFDKRTKTRREGKRGIADYAFKIGDKIVFYLEVKAVGIPLEKEADRQVVSYALSKRIPFAVSTNFEELKIFCVEYEDAQTQTFRMFKKPETYIEDFSGLSLLSKENFEKGATQRKAEDENRLKRRVAIDKLFLEDLMNVRKLLVENIEKTYSGKYDLNEKEEIVQRIIDRLIFIRRCEDEGINPDTFSLKEITGLPHDEAYPKLKNYFKKYNEVYNSGLFSIGIDNDCDKIKIDGEIIKNLIEYLYDSKDKKYIYKFGKDGIDADVLGQVYEQYLGKILQQTKSGKAKLKEGQAHRKEQGIYYTPTYIVDYIVKNTVLEVLKSKKIKSKEIKVLDSACGSGSFLIKAFDYLYGFVENTDDAKQYKIDNQGSYSIKTEILKKNLYGVDLDNKAVEITKLNLLLKAAEKERKLPEEIDLHIKHGNSLVNDDKIDKNAFIWENDFEKESFDIIIGNPPYVFTRDVEFQGNFKEYVQKNYFKGLDSISKSHARQSGKVNLYALFLIKGISLLKNGGLFGYIIPNNILRTTTYDIIRKYILDNCKIVQIIDTGTGVFEGVTASTIILILKKETNEEARNKNKVQLLNFDNLKDKKEIEQKEFLKNTSYAFNTTLNKQERTLFDRIEKNTAPLGEISIIHAGGIATGKNKKEMIENHKKNDKYKPMLEGKDIKPYYPVFSEKYILYDKKLLYRARDESIFLTPEKLVTQRIGGGNNVLVVSYDNQKNYTFNSTNTILQKDTKYSLKYIVALLNSKLMNWYYVNKFSNKSMLTVNISKTFLEQLPIKKATDSQKKEIVSLVDSIISYKKELERIGKKTTSETKQLTDKINSFDNKINDFVYQLYELGKEDIDSIEKE